MKSKTIKAVLRKKFDAFLASIDDPEVKKLVKKNSMITGGAIASMLLQEPVNDYDVYFTNRETVLAVCNYYINKFSSDKYDFAIKEDGDRVSIEVKSIGVAIADGFKMDAETETIAISMTNPDGKEEVKVDPPYRPVYISSNAITLSDQMQLVIRFYGNPQEIHENYDFAHCMNYWTSGDSDLVLSSEALECLLTKELRYKGSKYPLASIIRTRKFINRGFTVNAGNYLKMCIQLNDMDLRDITVLRDQLTGVDATYFIRLLNAIPKDKIINNEVDGSYLISLIDMFF